MKKLSLNKETIRNLSVLDLNKVAGGGVPTDTCTATCDVVCNTLACPISGHPKGQCVTWGGKCVSGVTTPC